MTKAITNTFFSAKGVDPILPIGDNSLYIELITLQFEIEFLKIALKILRSWGEQIRYDAKLAKEFSLKRAKQFSQLNQERLSYEAILSGVTQRVLQNRLLTQEVFPQTPTQISLYTHA